MTPDDAVSAIKGQLKNWTSTAIDTWCINELNAAVRRLQRAPELPWFLFVDTDVDGTNLSTVAGTEYVTLPSNFLREDAEREYCLYVQDTSEDDQWVALVKEDYSIVKARETESARPKYYDIIGSNIYLRAVPDAVYTLRVMYYKKDDVIAAGSTETTWLTQREDLLIAEAGFVIASQYLADAAAAQMFDLRRKEERQLLQHEIVARHEAARSRRMGDR